MRALGCWLVALSIQLHGMPAAGSLPVSSVSSTPQTGQSPAGCRPWVRLRDGMVEVGAKRCSSDALVIVYRPYEVSSETFWAAAGSYTTEPTLHHGRGLRVWLRFTDGTEQSYRKRMRYTR